MQLHQPDFLEELAQREGRLLIFSFAPPEKLQAWIPHWLENFLAVSYQEKGLNFDEPAALELTTFAADPTLDIYHRYGLDRNSYREVYGMSILRQYAKWRSEGKPVKLPPEDPLQRGGDFVVGRDGRLTLSHTGRNQSERPSLTDILAAME